MIEIIVPANDMELVGCDMVVGISMAGFQLSIYRKRRNLPLDIQKWQHISWAVLYLFSHIIQLRDCPGTKGDRMGIVS